MSGPTSDPVSLGTPFLQAGLLAFLLLGVRRRNASIAANALVALAATFLPALVEYGLFTVRGVAVSVDGIVAFWIAVAGFLHMLGMFGLYENGSTWWWDHVTHLVSAAFVAAVVYGGVHGIARASPGLDPPAAIVAGLTLLSTLAVGVFWELLELVVHRYSRELGVEAVLIPYGRRDTALDLVFDVVGALLVVVLDVRTFVPVAAAVPSLSEWFLLAAGVSVVVGSFVSVLVMLLWDVGPGTESE